MSKAALRKILPIAVILLMSLSAMEAKAACNREALRKTAEGYLSALSAHTPEKLLLGENARFSENGKELKIGEGLWKTAGKVMLSRSVIDTAQCGAHTQAVIEEEKRPIIFCVRLKTAPD
jgi:poly(3-hydroxyalkanoate) synthetase